MDLQTSIVRQKENKRIMATRKAVWTGRLNHVSMHTKSQKGISKITVLTASPWEIPTNFQNNSSGPTFHPSILFPLISFFNIAI